MRGVRRFGLCVVLCSCAVLAGCRSQSKAKLPAGALIAGDVAALSRVLLGLEELEGTPLARWAGSLRTRLEGCHDFQGSSAPGDVSSLFEAIECRRSDSLTPSVVELRAAGDVVFILPIEGDGSGGRLIGRAFVDDEANVRIEARFDQSPRNGFAAFLLPAKRPPGSFVLSDEDALLHGRIRPLLGLNLASMVPNASQADNMFKLKSALFSNAVLDGTLELAVYMPPKGERMPLMAVTAGMTSKTLAIQAVQEFLAQIEMRWPLHHVSKAFGPYEGACMPELELFPEMAPCYAFMEHSLVVGWNPESVEQALFAKGVAAEPDQPGIFYVYLNRLAEADRRLHDAVAPATVIPHLRYGWDYLELDATNRSGEITFRAELRKKQIM